MGLAGLGLSQPADATAELLTRIRQHMADNLARLPNYTCLETIERTAKPPRSKRFLTIDRVRLDVAYIGKQELYSWPGEGKFQEKTIGQIVGSGAAISSGSFALHANALFRSEAAQFSSANESQDNGIRTVRFDFRVSKQKSRYAIDTGGLQPDIVPYHGFIEANADTLALMRIEVRADDLPADLKLVSTNEIIQYAQSRIGDADFLLPESSDLILVEPTGRESRNLIRFEDCHQFTGASNIRFDDPTADAKAPQPAGPIELPKGLTVEAALRDPVGGENARGDIVYAIVLGDVKKSGQLIIPKGAILAGHITRIETRYVRYSVYFGAGMEFDAIEFDGRRGDFSAELEQAGLGTGYFVGKSDHGESMVYLETRARAKRLPAGMRMLFKTK